ncbi:MAG: glycosyltransferase family 4 protein, partial [Acidimicrobiales bacterium]|nr:glycosyltransferase family 4 protein [Acidimicrobiales bacterium]
DSLITHFELPSERVVTVSAGYETPRLPSVNDPSVSPLARSLLESGRPFFVYPAVTHPHKNHSTVLRAFAALRDSDRQPLLVFTGGAGAAHGQVDDLVRTLELGDSVLRLGRVRREVLDLLIGRAEALVFPSEFEGFGIPILEAMALGCPVIAADATAVPEVVGSAGILVPPTDVEAWRATMAERLADNPPRAEVAAAGRARAARYAWAASGERLEAVYRVAAGGVAG